jgi:hypothetical protein
MLMSLPLRQHLVRARLAAGAGRNPGSRLHLLVLREAWWRLDLLPDRIAHGERQEPGMRIKIRVRHQDCGVSRVQPPSMYEYFHGAVWQRKKLS